MGNYTAVKNGCKRKIVFKIRNKHKNIVAVNSLHKDFYHLSFIGKLAERKISAAGLVQNVFVISFKAVEKFRKSRFAFHYHAERS